MEKVRGFEVAKGFENMEINLPERKTKYSAGYDIEAAEDTVVPSFKKGSNPTFHGSENIKKMKISDFIGKETSSDDVKLAKKNLLSKNKKVMSSLIISPKDEMMNVNGKEKSRMDLVLDKMFNKVMSLGLKQKKKTNLL